MADRLVYPPEKTDKVAATLSNLAAAVSRRAYPTSETSLGERAVRAAVFGEVRRPGRHRNPPLRLRPQPTSQGAPNKLLRVSRRTVGCSAPRHQQSRRR